MKRLSIAAAVAACTAAVALPSGATAGPVEDLVGHVQNTVNQTLNNVNGLLNGGNGGGSGNGAPAPAPAPSPTPQAEGGTTDPELDGTNPHGQGEVLDVSSGLETVDGIVGDVVVGQSRGEQDEAGNYSGKVTILSALGLDISVESDESNPSMGSPLEPINEALDPLCDPGGTDPLSICLDVLEFSTETRPDGSSNSFSVLDADVLNGTVGATALASEGNISHDDECQEATSSAETGLNVGDGAVTADALRSSSRSKACNDGTEEVEKDGEVANLGALDDINIIEIALCDTTEEDTEFNFLNAGLISGVCNGDDTNGTEADSPYNIRKALGLDLVELLDLAGVDASTSETHAVAPERQGPECPDPTNPDCPPIDECPDPTNPDCPPIDECPDPSNAACPAPAPECPDPANPDCPPADGEGPGPGGPSADAPDDDLPFTGADMGTLGAIGIGIMAIGLALMALLDRRRQTLRG